MEIVKHLEKGMEGLIYERRIMAYSKYGNKKTYIDGFKFDSKAEAARYSELLLLQKGKVISRLTLQPKFLIHDGFVYRKKKEQAIHYVADFSYLEISTGKEVVEDVKGVETDVFKIKRKMFLKIYGDQFDFRVVK